MPKRVLDVVREVVLRNSRKLGRVCETVQQHVALKRHFWVDDRLPALQDLRDDEVEAVVRVVAYGVTAVVPQQMLETLKCEFF